MCHASLRWHDTFNLYRYTRQQWAFVGVRSAIILLVQNN